MVRYSVADLKDLTNIIILHLDKYPLLTQRAADFILFKRVVELKYKKTHLTSEGLHKIVNIKTSMNWGLSEIVKSEFINFTLVDRPIILTKKIPNPNWLAGFVNGEGNFDVNIIKSKSNKIGYQVQLRFRIKQHERDRNLLEVLNNYLGAGKIEKDPSNPIVCLTIVKFTHITKIIIPFFEKNPLHGVNVLDYLDWCKVAKIMNEGSHLTIEGLDLIRTIKSKMNTGRKFK